MATNDDNVAAQKRAYELLRQQELAGTRVASSEGPSWAAQQAFQQAQEQKAAQEAARQQQADKARQAVKVPALTKPKPKPQPSNTAQQARQVLKASPSKPQLPRAKGR